MSWSIPLYEVVDRDGRTLRKFRPPELEPEAREGERLDDFEILFDDEDERIR